jgi:hypothetical protein
MRFGLELCSLLGQRLSLIAVPDLDKLSPPQGIASPSHSPLHFCQKLSTPPAQVLDCVGQSVQMFDEVNVATALHRLAKLQPPGPGSHPSPIIYADQFQQLVAAVGRLLPQFEAQAVSNTMWGENSRWKRENIN